MDVDWTFLGTLGVGVWVFVYFSFGLESGYFVRVGLVLTIPWIALGLLVGVIVRLVRCLVRVVV